MLLKTNASLYPLQSYRPNTTGKPLSHHCNTTVIALQHHCDSPVVHTEICPISCMCFACMCIDHHAVCRSPAIVSRISFAKRRFLAVLNPFYIFFCCRLSCFSFANTSLAPVCFCSLSDFFSFTGGGSRVGSRGFEGGKWWGTHNRRQGYILLAARHGY
jgi:hypothetical protein